MPGLRIVVLRDAGMSLPLTAEMMEAAYDYLRSTPPFSSWGLPHSDEVVFFLSSSRRKFGWYQWDGDRHTITASIHAIAYTSTLMQFMSHEMIHLNLEMRGLESRKGSDDVHNKHFRKFAGQVCRYHGFDPKAFY
jgi:hypothetical protein